MKTPAQRNFLPASLQMNGVLFAGIVACLVSAGCGTANVNPHVARAGTGYVDFYMDAKTDLWWEVKRGTENGGDMRTVYSEYKPIEGRILRLAAPPGTHRFQVWFSNTASEGPEVVTLQVAEGKVTPVRVTLTHAGSASVLSQSSEYRPTGRATRQVTRTTAQESAVFRIAAEPRTPQAYQPKERMEYY